MNELKIKKHKSVKIKKIVQKDTSIENREEYTKLLELLFYNLRSSNPELIKKKKTLSPPIVKRAGIKIIWSNFNETCIAIKREPSHVMRFFMTEFGVPMSINGERQLIIKGCFTPRLI